MRNAPGSSPGGDIVNTTDSIYVLSIMSLMRMDSANIWMFGISCHLLPLPDFDSSIFSELVPWRRTKNSSLTALSLFLGDCSTPSNELLFHSTAWRSGSAALIRSIRTVVHNIAKSGCLFRPLYRLMLLVLCKEGKRRMLCVGAELSPRMYSPGIIDAGRSKGHRV